MSASMLPVKAANRSQVVMDAAHRSSSAEPESAAELVWGIAPTVRPRVHVVFGQALTANEIVPLQLDALHPDVLVNTTTTEFLAKSLVSRAAKRQDVAALALSATYLPSQLATIADLAGKQQLDMQVYISADNSTLHAVVSVRRGMSEGPEQEPTVGSSPAAAVEAALSAVLGPMVPLSPAKLHKARTAESTLQQQLRLWDPATWSLVLQQKLEARGAYTALAVRSLMGPPALQAARQLVTKKGLYWLELQPGQMQALAASEAVDTKASSSSSSRRRPKRGGGAAAATGSANEDEVQPQPGRVIVLSRLELTVDEAVELPAESFTDHGISGGHNSRAAAVASDTAPASPRIAWPNIFGK